MRVRVGWALMLLVVAALEFVSSYRGLAAPVLFVLAAVLPFAVIRLGQLAKAGTFAPALGTIVLASGGAWLALHRSTSSSLGGLGDALPRLLTTARPAPASAALLAPPLLLVTLVGTVVAACVLAPAARLGGRVGGLLAPVLGTAAIYVPAQLLSAGSADPHGLVAVCLLVVIAAGWSLPYLRGGLRVAWRPGVVVPIVGVAAVALAAAAASTATAFDPRRHVTPPTVHLDEASPLSQLSSWSANPSLAILQATVKGTRRLHLATLSRFTGDTWQVDERYQQVSLTSSGDLPPGDHTAPAKATVRIVRLSGIWLPAPGVATSTSLSGTLVDPNDGTLARPEHARPGLTYDVTAQVPAPTPDQLSVAAVPQTVPTRYTALPHAPTGFAQYARAAVRGASTPLEEAVAIEHAVATNRQLVTMAPSGSSYGRLQTFLFGRKGSAGAQVGTDEQFAASFAVLAREIGLPTRLVVGFVLDQPAANGTITVHGRDATVWPEVYLGGIGWVPFAPTPGGSTSSADSNLRQSVLKRLSEQAAVLPVPDPIAAPKNLVPKPAKPTTGAATAAHHASGVSTGLLSGIGVAVLVLLLLGGLAGLRMLRSRRHRRQGARGAWSEVVDLLVLIGRRPAVGQAAPAIAAEVDESFGGPAAGIARAADREAFAPVAGPGAEVWSDVRVLHRRARSTLPRYRRVLMPVDPRPLLARRR